MGAPVLEIKGLEKSFGGKPVLRGVDLTLEAGSHVGLAGNNGEGKTTLLKLMLGLLKPDRGEVRIRGELAGFPRGRRHKSLCGYLPESVSFYPNLNGRQTLRFLASLKGAPRTKVDSLLELVDLREAAGRPVKTYSKGMRQRLGLAQALLGDPVLLLLDEPTSGLDPKGIRDFYTILENLQTLDVTILTASHLLAEIETRLDHLSLLRNGVLEISGPIPQLIAEAGLEVRVKVALAKLDSGVLAELERLGAVASPNGHANSFEIKCLQQNKVETLTRLLKHQRDIAELAVHEPGLEEVFHHYQTGPVRNPPLAVPPAEED